MDVTSNSRARTGMNASSPDAFRMRAQKQRAERTEVADRRDNARTARVRVPEREKDTYDPGAGARVAHARPSPDSQRYVAQPRSERNHQAESRRSTRA